MALSESDEGAATTTTPLPPSPAEKSPSMLSDTPVVIDHSVLEATTTTEHANSTTNGKRKRSVSATPPSQSPKKKSPDERDAPAMRETTEDTVRRRKVVMAEIVKDLLVVLKEHDPNPSILTYPISSTSPSLNPEGPPNKRAKLSPSTPNTIAERLGAGTYATLNPVLADISAVCGSLLAAAANSCNPSLNGDGALTNGNGTQDAIPLVAQIVHFEEFARDVITRERLRRADLFDFAEEFNGEEGARPSNGGKVALTVMGHHGPLFSSLQNPITVPAPRTETLSRSSSTSESPSSTAPTSTATSPKHGPLKVYRVVAPLNESALPPLISTVKAVSSDPKSALKSGRDPEKVLTLAEAFPPLRTHTLPPPKPYPSNNPPAIGLKWGGVIAPGGVSASNPSSTRPDPAGEWLSYRNHPPRDSKHRPRRGEPIRLGMGLPADFVIAYSSFAPTKDDSGAKVPSRMRERVWWEKRGGELFRRMFKHDPGVGHLFAEYEKRETVLGEVVENEDAMQVEEDEEEMIRKAVESWEPDSDVPVDFRLLDTEKTESEMTDAEETLKEISDLLQSLRSHQYIRLSTLPPIIPPRVSTGSNSSAATTPTPVVATPQEPTAEEVALYDTLKTRLAALIASLPPHLTATIDGTLDAPLNVSTKIPIFEGGAPVYKGTLPEDPKPGQTTQPPGQAVQGAAMAALNAAVGMSPMSPAPSFSAPVAMMSSNTSTTQRMNVPVPAPPTPTRIPGVPHVQTFHGHHMPPSYTPAPQQFHAHQMPAAAPSVTTPHHYPSPYAPAPFPPSQQQPPPPRVVGREETRVVGQQFHGHSMPGSPSPAFGVYAGYPGTPTPAPSARGRLNVPPPQGLAAVGVGVMGGYSGYGRGVTGDELRMGVQHTQASMENGTVPGGRYAGRSRR